MNPVGQLVRRYGSPGASVLTPAELAAVPALRRYLTAFYFSLVTLLTLGYGDIVPSTPIETVVDIVQIAVGVLVFGIILSALADAVTRSSSEARRAQVRGQAAAGSGHMACRFLSVDWGGMGSYPTEPGPPLPESPSPSA